MAKFRITVEYDGTAYHGWQLQKSLPTVQGALEGALSRILTVPVRVHGAGRTDAGVHATGQVAHFSADWNKSLEALQKACNALLPPDVVVRNLVSAPEDFHARHSAQSKTYVYTILNGPLRCALNRHYTWHIPFSLDVDAMKHAAKLLEGTHDFAAFGSPTEGTPSTVRRILSAHWSNGNSSDTLQFTIIGTGFLRYMVRSLVGTLVPVGAGKIDPTAFGKILESCDRSQSGPTAPPHGLCLALVEY
ncbi:tRNA pseudouridine(38-40) synthase TruA [Desulfomonile tiedjei]|uniref:tRNA pseudouridine synthase A n=1 Tax=Desulfomonile tiedjei (strain ATCC 49306 / DSM 6799 / DCB-1) TaxID=706587 RepID=I4C033_DESTA|nr:tRNA pseudouridine(38-40) synthase TruA [Desulfomonile tiedjei]AFM22924.1 pseudouridylate synthase I [Desulfomonile tiedjei DSM 6799]